MFNMTYWPYIQSAETYLCTRKFFSDSYDNLIMFNERALAKSAGIAIAFAILLQEF